MNNLTNYRRFLNRLNNFGIVASFYPMKLMMDYHHDAHFVTIRTISNSMLASSEHHDRAKFSETQLSRRWMIYLPIRMLMESNQLIRLLVAANF